MRNETARGGSNVKKIAIWAVAAGIYALIGYLSFQTGDETSELNENIIKFLELFFRLDPENAIAFVNGLRKAAHVLEFAALTAAVYPAVSFAAPKNRALRIVSLLACVAMAVCSEVFKVFIPGRHFDCFEMFLNLTGCLAGILAAKGVGHIWRTRTS